MAKQSPLISKRYRDMNALLHAQSDTYGTSGHKWGNQCADLAMKLKATDVLDYGCGKGTFTEAFERAWEKVAPDVKTPKVWYYDPALPGIHHQPAPRDLVVCTDVLEHIEPECLDAVLDDLKRVTKMVCFAVIATRPAKKMLSDGRNAHLIIQTHEWWHSELRKRFGMILSTVNAEKGEYVVELYP